MKINNKLLYRLSKIKTKKIKLKTFINRIVKKIVNIKLIKIKPITNTLNAKTYVVLRKDQVKSNNKLNTYIGSAPKKNNYFIIIPNIF